MKKGIAAIFTVILAMVMVLVAFIIFSSLSSGSFLQEKALLGKQAEATGEIPCTRSPDVQFTNAVEGAVYINPPKGITWTPQKADVLLNAKVSSSCLEDLDVVWNFGDGTLAENNCTYVAGKGYYVVNSTGGATGQNCSSMNHTYALSLSDVWTIKDIKLQVFGLRSAFYSEASAAGFVTDPNFQVSIKGTPDISDYSCVLLDVNATNSKFIASNSADENIHNLRLDAVDNKRTRSVDAITYLPGGEEAKFTYRAYFDPNAGAGKVPHVVRVFATKGYQTVNSSAFSYVSPSNINPRKEILAYAGRDNPGLDVWYNSSSNNQWACVKDNGAGQCARNTFPQLTDKETPVAVASGDVNLDGESEIITLMQGVGSNPSELFEFKNSEFLRTSDFKDTSLDSLKDQWAHADLPKETWRDVAIGNIKVGNKLITNAIIALSDDSLMVYQVQGQNLVLISDGKDLPKKGTLQIDHWVG
ncbi:MAG: hypothetical protein NTY99_00425, partial [DPANN group archaeon]|nr:hypothetical protein [DPANN group archaeon]